MQSLSVTAVRSRHLKQWRRQNSFCPSFVLLSLSTLLRVENSATKSSFYPSVSFIPLQTTGLISKSNWLQKAESFKS
jgi:hypothetical protein